MANPASPRDAPLDPAPSGAGSLFACALLLAALASPAAADPVRGALSAGAGLVRFDYTERSIYGKVIDTERGWLPALRLHAGLSTDRWFLAAEGSLASGGAAYDGRTQSANPDLHGLPVETTTDEALARAELHFGAWLDPARHLALVVGGAARRWDRDIRPTTVVSRAGVTSAVGGLHEIYGWGELFTGLRAGADLCERLRVELEARVVQGVLPRITVELGGERVTLRLGERLGWGASLGGRLALPRRWELGVAVEAEGYRFGRSPIDPATGLMEPDSETLGASIVARIGRGF